MKRAFVAGSSVAGVLALIYSVYLVGAAHIRDAVARIGWGFGAILLLSGLRDAARALAWTRTIEGGPRLSLRHALRARLAGEALNTLLPFGFVVGEPAKAEHVAERLPFSTAFTALMVELAFYSASLLLLFVAGVVSVSPLPAIVPIAAFVVAGFAVAKNVRRMVRPLLDFAKRQPRRVYEILWLEAFYHALAIAEVYLTVALISGRIPTLSAAVVLETVNRGVTVFFKMVPMRMGVDEASAAIAAERLALGTSTGLMLALVRKLRMLFWSAVGLALMVVRARKQPVRAYTAAA